MGNLKPLAYFMSIYPVSGELVKGVRTMIKGQQRSDEGVERLMNDMMAVGGLGVVTDAFTQAKFGRTLEFAAGPFLSDVADLTTAAAQGDPGAVGDMISRQPIYAASQFLFGVGGLTAEVIDGYLEGLDIGSDSGDSLKTAEELQMEAATRKR